MEYVYWIGVSKLCWRTQRTRKNCKCASDHSDEGQVAKIVFLFFFSFFYFFPVSRALLAFFLFRPLYDNLVCLLFFLFLFFIPLSLIRLVSWGATASTVTTATPSHLEATTHTPGHTTWGLASGAARGVTAIPSIATASVPLIITTTITSPASIASISTIPASPLTSGSTPLASTTTPLVTSTASHHVAHVGVHTAGVLWFGSHFFHFQFMAADVNCALFQELFGYVFTLVGDKTKVFALILDLKKRKKIALI